MFGITALRFWFENTPAPASWKGSGRGVASEDGGSRGSWNREAAGIMVHRRGQFALNSSSAYRFIPAPPSEPAS